jgi:4-hydroxy-2-oxoheptanedioate aldolase
MAASPTAAEEHAPPEGHAKQKVEFMRRNILRQRAQAGEASVNGWLSIPSAYAAEVLGHQGFDSVTVDLQHGMIGFDAAISMLQAISATPAMPMARVGKNDSAMVMQLLDAGAYGIICPMISSASEARDFAAFCRYPPRGKRSFGPARGLLYGGNDYFKHADDEVLCLAMIETTDGLRNIDRILAVEELDGVYIGPNDLALALGCPPSGEPTDPIVIDAIQAIRDATYKASKIAGIFCSSGEAAATRLEQGFGLVTPGNDVGLLSKAAKAAIGATRRQCAGAMTGTSGY